MPASAIAPFNDRFPTDRPILASEWHREPGSDGQLLTLTWRIVASQGASHLEPR
jgi:hypothetical protein